jgi:competence protein ComEA
MSEPNEPVDTANGPVSGTREPSADAPKMKPSENVSPAETTSPRDNGERGEQWRRDLALIALLLGVTGFLGVHVWVTRFGRGDEDIQVRVGSSDYKVDVNAASELELTLLPGIGPGLARRIAETRTRVGRFNGPEDLRKIRGIGPKTLEAMLPAVRFGPPSAEE